MPGALGYRLRRIAERLRQPFPDSYLQRRRAHARRRRASDLLGDAVRRRRRRLTTAAWRGRARRRRLDALDRCVAIDFASYLPDDILVKLDRMAMANSLEGRAPLLDHGVVDFAVNLPRELRVQGGRGKHLLRRVGGALAAARRARTSRSRASASRSASGSAGRSAGSPPTSSAAAPSASAA